MTNLSTTSKNIMTALLAGSFLSKEVAAKFDYGDTTYHFDSNGLATRQFVGGGDGRMEVSGISQSALYEGALTVEEALVLASKQDGWNPCFDRKDIPELMNLISAQLR